MGVLGDHSTDAGVFFNQREGGEVNP